ncbi:ATP-binding protein [Acinetobacter bereziniae]|uniref:ATP-binding protein n=1 Tax=Acinetobacter bereziniae TaxID=106648 RepID=UPI00124FEABB|nr:ATP-binding protein [Acinetobacter bereziniae]
MEIGKVSFRSVTKIPNIEGLRLCNETESHYVDFKSSRIKPADILQHVVAFSNADGGFLFIGIEDNKTNLKDLDKWIGFKSLENIDPYLAVIRDIRGLEYDWWYYQLESKQYEYVLGVKISSSKDVVFTLKGECYLRDGTSSRHIKDLKVQRSLRFAKGSESYEDIYQNDCKIENLEESVQLDLFIKSTGLQYAEKLEFLEQENLINNDWVPNTACVLLFCEQPAAFIPQAAIRVACYNTNGVDELRDDLIFNERFEGNIFSLIDQCFDLIKSKLSSMYVWTINGEVAPVFHDDALFEVLVNCVVHRDYYLNDPILVKIFNNRIVFKSPGKLPRGIDFENILRSRNSRNPKIMRYLSKANRTKDGKKYVQEMGEGLNTVTNRMREARLQDPVFGYEDNSFVVTLIYGTREKIEHIVLKFIDKFIGITNKQLADILGIASHEASIKLSSLRRKDIIEYDHDLKKWFRLKK